MAQEQTIWTGTPSHAINFGTYLVCLLFGWLVLPLFYLFWKWLEVRTTRYELTSQRLRLRSGILNKETQDLELYRVKDYRMDQPFFLRLFSAADIVLATSDRSHPTVVLRAVKEAEPLLDKIRDIVEELRRSRGVHEID